MSLSLEAWEQELTRVVAGALTNQRANDNSTIYTAVQAAWDGGYHSAVLALRELAIAIPNKQLAANARTLAGLLEHINL